MNEMINPIDDLKNNSTDNWAIALRSAVGAIPYVGPLFSELITFTIPNQRVDRLVEFVKIIHGRLSKLEEKMLEDNLANPMFLDLLEESVSGALKSASIERKEYIANLLINSLSQSEVELLNFKQLLTTLNDLNDIEVIWLIYYQKLLLGGSEEFRNKYEIILSPVVAVVSDPQIVKDKEILQKRYKEHLSQLGLIDVHQNISSDKEKLVQRTKSKSYDITPYGRLLLRAIGIIEIDELDKFPH